MTRVLTFLACALVAVAAVAEPVVLTAADGLKVHAEVWRAATVLLVPPK